MKNFKIKPTVITFSAIGIAFITLSWGIFGHEHINNAAVMALPKPMQTFFYNHLDFITQESTVPDLRKYTLRDKAENPRHYMDLENFGAVESIPLPFEEAKKKYDEKFLTDNGILPWYIQEVMTKLTKAMKDKRKTEILFLAADLAHYIGDANMPLHTSANHDGQLTNQKGIHSMFESRIPEMFGKNYNFYTGEAKYIDNVEKATWDMLKDSHSQVEPLLLIDRKLRATFTPETLYDKDEKGNIAKNKFGDLIYSKEYVTQFHTALNGMVESQMRKAIIATTNFWYTAWVNAGKPDLDGLDSKEMTNRNKKNLKNDLKLWKNGKLFGLESENDF
ncbi:MAG TPA: zinc dependent phospholipase C family protein [Flavobacterium sp.]|uniref:zinc dependent phospholipase C family protein n=1 Tax=Flavobacterium sp. TaxID=239 RepID=UPI002DBFD1CC|nr:zinc dependent phospholipase C family protein [Flavobacterium sp.]HEU4789812.1 zinc dependent phospholipase C family protein [Flavobacterium sp.]